jgi:hypothetical protein
MIIIYSTFLGLIFQMKQSSFNLCSIGPAYLFCKGPDNKYLGFVGQMVSVKTV